MLQIKIHLLFSSIVRNIVKKDCEYNTESLKYEIIGFTLAIRNV